MRQSFTTPLADRHIPSTASFSVFFFLQFWFIHLWTWRNDSKEICHWKTPNTCQASVVCFCESAIWTPQKNRLWLTLIPVGMHTGAVSFSFFSPLLLSLRTSSFPAPTTPLCRPHPSPSILKGLLAAHEAGLEARRAGSDPLVSPRLKGSDCMEN